MLDLDLLALMIMNVIHCIDICTWSCILHASLFPIDVDNVDITLVITSIVMS